MKMIQRRARLARTVAVGCLATVTPFAAQADLIAAYLFSGQTSPSNASSPTFTVNATGVRQLTLNASGVATASSAVANLSFLVQQALTANTIGGTVNSGEPSGGTLTHVNSEVGTWDDVGIVSDGNPDAARNVDFGYGAWVKFNRIGGGFLDLIIAEDAALDPFRLSICDTTCTTIFGGFDTATRAALRALPDFAENDSSVASEMDQGFLFRFNAPVTGLVKIKEIGDFGGAKLEVDFIGVGTVVPIPAAAWLFGSALLGVAGIGYRRRASSA